MGKKKFIDKKRSATFCLVARDSSDPVYAEGPENDRVFVRVDNNHVSISGLNESEYEYNHENDPKSVFADASDDVNYGDEFSETQSASLPDNLRREILELGFPDDGYNYLTHLREIRNIGRGSAYFESHKANIRIPDDVKAYDASRVRLAQVTEDTSQKTFYEVTKKTVNVRVQKAVDPEIAKLLDEAESELGSDIDELEEDFVVQANIIEEPEDVLSEKSSASDCNGNDVLQKQSNSHGVCNELTTNFMRDASVGFTEKPRVHRLIDQQFDLLVRQEYGTDSDDGEHDGSCTEKHYRTGKGPKLDDLQLDENYRAPAVISHGKEAEEIVRRCVEYAENYENEDINEMGISEESSDESENFDCETIVSIYTNLDNHPGQIDAPETDANKRMTEKIFGALKTGTNSMISLGGKNKLPVDYLPNGRKAIQGKAKPVAKAVPMKIKPIGEETKEEKKERKAVVKEERQEARRAKKELKVVYRGEATLAQKVSADSGPSSIHLT